MERGTAWEREAVRARWAELAARERAATRLLRGLVISGVGLVLLLVAPVSEACLYRPGGWAFRCEPVGGVVPPVLLVALGVLAVAAGLWACWTAVRSREPTG